MPPKYMEELGVPKGFKKVTLTLSGSEMFVTALICETCQMLVIRDYKNTYAFAHLEWHDEMNAELKWLKKHVPVDTNT